ncbi:unnamed protein product [Dovyalis caffra]|uniref:Uncharacterized protein n=1 Tax=Dovyalis caffra TaxID=77055 RepID=A0AAV1RGL1_9ROSI|nr:unnamed protein product [Dovyalis caffra]
MDRHCLMLKDDLVLVELHEERTTVIDLDLFFTVPRRVKLRSFEPSRLSKPYLSCREIEKRKRKGISIHPPNPDRNKYIPLCMHLCKHGIYRLQFFDD